MRKSKAASKEKELLSLDIGTYSLKIVIGKIDKDMIMLDKAFTVPIPSDLYQDGQIINIQKLKDVIEGTLEANKIRTKSVVCTLESSTIITREIVLPMVKPQELKEMVRYEIQQYLPIELEQYVIQYKLLEEFKEGDTKHANIWVAALPKTIVESYLSLLESLNLKPVALDIHSNTVAKIIDSNCQINKAAAISDKTVALIDLGHHHMNVTILDNGSFKFNRLLNMGGKDIETNLSNFLDFSVEQAKIKKLEASDISEIEGDYSEESRTLNIIKSSIDTWIDEIERVFKYHTTRSTGNKIDEIYLFGGSANQTGIEKYMEESVNIPTYKIKTISNVNTSGIKGNIDLTGYINALGAMIRR
ncbi:type IV pilus assembly protein PilM [Geosporobacter ferrireducens]|uniref:SHS2 domain-containing protein n=1 Tax=Geosporobacter ferrireducens TaxID=1424294 RepID=A0A1D8GB89_9FIRM|nr:type IV pilus assembly protein PilM [Geosporobacter ferrireducens]AOT68175.1 hypothetical protein Gferi_00400 [Geosporobacter ferrireducens]